MLVCYRKYGAQTRYWNRYGYWPCSFLDKFVSLFFLSLKKSTGATSRFIDGLCAINNDGEFSESFKCINPGELELKLEQSGTDATFLDLDIENEDGIFVYKFFDKRDKFPSSACDTLKAIFYQPCSMVLYFQYFRISS